MLDLWDRASVERSWRRALVLAGAERLDEAATWPLGQRDERLLALRRQLFGNRLPLRQHCPECCAELQTEVDLDDFPQAEPRSVQPIEHGDYRIVYRLPDSRILARVEGASSVEEARWLLIEGCIESAERVGAPVGAHELPDGVIQSLAEAIDAADPRANVEFSFRCDPCGTVFPVLFDVAACVWTEFDAWARRSLEEVHILASAYGWSEQEILSLSPNRRQSYIELATQ